MAAMRRAAGDGVRLGPLTEEFKDLLAKFKKIEARIFYTKIVQRDGIEESFYGVFCQY